ncbi:MAG: alanine--tRNA ligase, partial [Proteobacteria bacterium]|nr:alanine--tRNA ligase [Pseudomonadota bacterium]
KMVPALVKQMGQAYPELHYGQRMIEETLHLEEKRFIATLERGMKLLDKEIAGLGTGKILSGQTAFNLYDTYGFPLDLTQDVLREKGLQVDDAGFDIAMAEQKTRARAAWSGSGDVGEETIWFDIASDHGQTEFLGYKLETSEAQILEMVKNGKPCKTAQKGDAIDIVVNQTPFYAESGGQVGDMGQIKTENGSAEITDTVKRAGLIIHRAKMKTGAFAPNDSATLTVDNARRGAIRANHSATHLLHEALRQSLGDHVAQRGSLNDATRLRFDFSHTGALDAAQMTRVESEVNDYIRQNTPVDTRIMAVDDARALGAQALFGEKYGEEVRVVAMGRQDNSGKGMDKKTYSLELCGGTHVART